MFGAQKEVEREQAELGRLKEVLQIYGGDKVSGASIKAPISGYVLEKNINRGTQLRSDDANAVFTISQLNEIWVLANVNESDIGRIKIGLPAQIKTLSYPDRIFRGVVDKDLQRAGRNDQDPANPGPAEQRTDVAQTGYER